MIFHTAVLFYVPRVGRAIFRAKVRDSAPPGSRARARDILGFEDGRDGVMALARDGERVAWADGHGGSLSWG